MSSPSQTTQTSSSSVTKALHNLAGALRDNTAANESAPHLSHYRTLPPDVQSAYKLLQDGTTLIHGTSTKYTLVGKISKKDIAKLGDDLQHGCEILGAATFVLLQDDSGCIRPVRKAAVRTVLAIIYSVIQLVESFEDGSALQNNVGATKTGAVWEACNTVMNKLLPQGNRTAIRRDLFSWSRDCQDTMEEFQDLLDQGPMSTQVDRADSGVELLDSQSTNSTEGQYNDIDFPVAEACVALVKCSRGCMNVALQACEILGSNEDFYNDIIELYNMARKIGDGVTDFGTTLYPPLIFQELEAEMIRQVQCMFLIQDFILTRDDVIPSHITALARKLKDATETRQHQVLSAIAKTTTLINK